MCISFLFLFRFEPFSIACCHVYWIGRWWCGVENRDIGFSAPPITSNTNILPTTNSTGAVDSFSLLNIAHASVVTSLSDWLLIFSSFISLYIYSILLIFYDAWKTGYPSISQVAAGDIMADTVTCLADERSSSLHVALWSPRAMCYIWAGQSVLLPKCLP